MPDKDAAENVQQASTKKSSGPRTHQGKQKSRFNAMKHGIFSEIVVLPGESRQKYQSLWKRFLDAFQPVGGFEEFLVEKLAIQGWRYRRFLTAESAEIQQATDFVEWDKKNPKLEEPDNRMNQFDERDARMMLAEKLGVPFPPGHFDIEPCREIPSPDNLKTSMELLGKLRKEIQSSTFERGWDTAILKRIDEIDAHLGKTLLKNYIHSINVAELPEGEREGFGSPEKCKNNFLSQIDKEIHVCKGDLIEAERTRLEVLRHGVPESARLERLLQAATALDKSFDTTLKQLERAQQLRLGQPVAPRIDVTVSR